MTRLPSPASIATVSAMGLVQPASDTGRVTITATVESKKGTAKVHVTAP